MDRFTISLDEKLATAFDELIRERGYATRSEAVRDILRSHLQTSEQKRNVKGSCVAALSCKARGWRRVCTSKSGTFMQKMVGVAREIAGERRLIFAPGSS